MKLLNFSHTRQNFNKSQRTGTAILAPLTNWLICFYNYHVNDSRLTSGLPGSTLGTAKLLLLSNEEVTK
jgi:hypothetical protein